MILFVSNTLLISLTVNTVMPKSLNFYDVKKGKPFNTTDYSGPNTIKTKHGTRKQVVAIAPGGNKAYRFVPKNFKK